MRLTTILCLSVRLMGNEFFDLGFAAFTFKGSLLSQCIAHHLAVLAALLAITVSLILASPNSVLKQISNHS